MGGARHLTVSIIGYGNLATRLSMRLRDCGHTVAAIAGRNLDRAQALAAKLGPGTLAVDISPLSSHSPLPPSDLYIIAVSDDAIPQTIDATQGTDGLWVHTSGSTPADVFKGKRQRFGSLYPLQTFSKEREVDFRKITTYVEANSPADAALLKAFAETFSGKAEYATSEQRRALHVAATFACNFPNFMILQAFNLARSSGLDPQSLAPLIEETLQKLSTMTPEEAQTGPARRGDDSTIRRHLAALESHPDAKHLYQEVTAMITRYFHPINLQ